MANDGQIRADDGKMIDVILGQYRECAFDYRHFSSLIWQVPAVTAVIGGTLLAVTFNSAVDKMIRPFVIFVGLLLVIVMTIALEHYRLYELRRRISLNRFEQTLKTYGAVTIPRSSKLISEEIKQLHIDIPWRWSYRWSSYEWLRHMMYGIILLMCSILIFSVADIFHLLNIR